MFNIKYGYVFINGEKHSDSLTPITSQNHKIQTKVDKTEGFILWIIDGTETQKFYHHDLKDKSIDLTYKVFFGDKGELQVKTHTYVPLTLYLDLDQSESD